MPDEKAWVIRDVPEETRREVKAYAGKHGLTISEALTELVQKGLRDIPVLHFDLSGRGAEEAPSQIREDIHNAMHDAYEYLRKRLEDDGLIPKEDSETSER